MTTLDIKTRLVAHLKELHLPTIRATFDELAEMARKEALTFELIRNAALWRGVRHCRALRSRSK